MGRRRTRHYGWTTALGLFLLGGVTLWIWQAVRLVEVPSHSMAPTLVPGDIVTIRIDAYRHRTPRRGDIVVCHDPRTGELLIKRVIGLPGEYLLIWRGRVWINGRLLKEPYVVGRGVLEPPQALLLGRNQFWVMGDNRDHSDDSRDFGPVKKEQIVGRAVAIIWPWPRRSRL